MRQLSKGTSHTPGIFMNNTTASTYASAANILSTSGQVAV